MGPPLQEVRPLPPHPSRLRRATFPPRGRFRRRRIRTGSIGSAKPGAVVKPHQRQFLQTQGQVAREVSRKATPFLRAGNDAQSLRSASSVTGDRGKGEYGRISAHPEPSPGDSLVTFSSLRKSLAAAAAKFPGATNPRDAARRVVAQASFSCPYGAIHLLAPYEKRNHCLLPAGGGTPCA